MDVNLDMHLGTPNQAGRIRARLTKLLIFKSLRYIFLAGRGIPSVSAKIAPVGSPAGAFWFLAARLSLAGMFR